MPLPPYIHKQVDDNDEYQTIYAKVSDSATTCFMCGKPL